MRAIGAFGIAVEIPATWDARLFRHPGGEPTLHVASFALPPDDGDFGTRATERMGPGQIFLALTEYGADAHLVPGEGIYANPPPDELPLRAFGEHALLRPRPGQRGLQRFFTAAGRAFCLYAVIDPGGAGAHLTETAGRLLATLQIEPR